MKTRFEIWWSHYHPKNPYYDMKAAWTAALQEAINMCEADDSAKATLENLLSETRCGVKPTFHFIVRHWDEYPVNQACPPRERLFWKMLCFLIDNTVVRHEYAEENWFREMQDDANR